MTPSAADWRALDGAIAGEVLLPGSADYELWRKPAIARFHDLRPLAVVRCADPRDVAETISLARRSGQPAAVRSGGHCFAGHSSTSGIVIDVTPMGSVSVSDGVAVVGAGARLGEVYDALAEHDLTIPAGCGPSVGIAGLTLGGGLGILGRKHGLTCDDLLEARVVLGDGRVVDCDERHDPELFWALRGAGCGNFGVVTSLTFATIPAPVTTSFHLTWPHTKAAAVLEAWQAWAPVAPEELAASLLVTASGEVDRPPVAHLFGAMLGTDGEAAELLEELVARAGGDPDSAVREQLPYRQTKRYLAEHGPGDDRPLGHPYSKSEFFRRPLPNGAAAALVDELGNGRVAGQSRELDLTPWGGAYNRVAQDATAFVHRDELFLLKHGAVVDPGASTAERATARRWLARSWELVQPWASGGVYPNFPDPDLEDGPRAYYGTNYDRLVRIKASYDPEGFFQFEQSIPGPVPERGAPA
jgi:FAD/FMN-containing dehydrogenase